MKLGIRTATKVNGITTTVAFCAWYEILYFHREQCQLKLLQNKNIAPISCIHRNSMMNNYLNSCLLVHCLIGPSLHKGSSYIGPINYLCIWTHHVLVQMITKKCFVGRFILSQIFARKSVIFDKFQT